MPSCGTELGEKRDEVYVAVGKRREKAVQLIQWTLRTFRSSNVVLLHVHQPSPLIPTLLGKLPATQANPDIMAAFRKEEKEKMNKLLQSYLNIFCRAKVKASFIVVEAEQVQKGLVELLINHDIQQLVMGSVTGKREKVTRNSSKANYAAKNAPAFCEIFFIYKGQLVWKREASEEARFFPSQRKLGQVRLRSISFRDNKSERLYNPDNLQFNSFRLSTQCSVIRALVQNEETEEDMPLPRTSCSSVSSSGPCYAKSSTTNESVTISPAEIRGSTDSDTKLEEDSLYARILEVKADADKSKSEALVELLKREKLEAEAVLAMKKVKDITSFYSHEASLRREAEAALRSIMYEQERLIEDRLEVAGELQKTMRNVAVLDSRVQEANRRCDEAIDEFKLIQECIASLQPEKQRIQKQKMEAERWLDKWRGRRLTGGINRQGCGGLLDDVPELVEFSLLDLQTATCNFSESFKLGETGYGSVYKGELLGRTVSIKRLYAHDIQGPLQFQKEVQVLGKLRHPHLVNLIGACPEAWSVVCDYVPNTLHSRLFQKCNITPLPWKIRTRIISEIAIALLFLHSCHPEKIIHGDLKPENILLDFDLHCKISDFGISRLLSYDSLRCPSFRQYTEPKGAFLYTDPELHRTGQLSQKSDIYSFGIVILQLLTGQDPVGLVANVRRAMSCGKLASILDPCAGDWETFVVHKLSDVALRFCEPNSRDRPELTPSLVKELQQLHISQERQVPSFFLCPILQEIMCDPQVAADGFSYEGEAIREWLENGRETSPMTNLRLDYLHLTPNHSLRLAIQEWLCKC